DTNINILFVTRIVYRRGGLCATFSLGVSALPIYNVWLSPSSTIHVLPPRVSVPSLCLCFSTARLVRGDLTIQVNINDHLDIYCPHYPHGTSVSPPETLALYQVAEGQFRGCVKTEGAIKRWECNRPYAPFGPVLFSEKIQKHSPFSKGLEFLPGHHYYYSSLPMTDGPALPCLKLRLSVCCESSEYTPLPHHFIPLSALSPTQDVVLIFH
uniref:Ephrin-A4-like n=1 Tax=Scleropages formosus TaxID=113540 RepID=A0A8C9WG12_SCLFO